MQILLFFNLKNPGLAVKKYSIWRILNEARLVPNNKYKSPDQPFLASHKTCFDKYTQVTRRLTLVLEGTNKS